MSTIETDIQNLLDLQLKAATQTGRELVKANADGVTAKELKDLLLEHWAAAVHWGINLEQGNYSSDALEKASKRVSESETSIRELFNKLHSRGQ